MVSETPEKHPSGAKAHVDLIALAARLKSCPVTKLRFSAACKGQLLFDQHLRHD